MLQAAIDGGFHIIGLAMARDFTRLITHLNDCVMHLHNSIGGPGYLAPEFRAEKVGGRSDSGLRCDPVRGQLTL